jgi:hypothetical protein
MADDCLVGFRFLENDDLINDGAVTIAAENLFNEVVFDAAFDHLGAKAEDAAKMEDTRGFNSSGEFENIDFTEGFDFVF